MSIKHFVLQGFLLVALALFAAVDKGLAQCPPTSAPTALGPSGNIATATPTFTWTAVPGAQSYTLYVVRVSDEFILLQQLNITTTSFTPATGLPINVDLRWKVKAESSCGPGPYSAILYFRIPGSCPPNVPPTAISPSGNITQGRPTFSWTGVPGAESYTLYVLRVSDEAIILGQPGITTTSFTSPFTLPLDTDLRWKVKGESSCGPGPYTNSVYFRIPSATLCPPVDWPFPFAPSGETTNARPTFLWSPVVGASSYTLYVQQASDGAILLRQTGITSTSFTPASPLPVGLDMRWKVKGESVCGPGPYSPINFFRITTGPPPQYNVDTNGDGRPDSITVLGNGIQVYHSNDGSVRFYSYSSTGGSSFSITRVENLDTAAGAEMVVTFHVNSDQGGIDVIHDNTGVVSRYSYVGRSFNVYGLEDTDGVAGNEIIVVWTTQTSTNGVDVIHETTRSVRTYYQNRQFGIAAVIGTDAAPGKEIVVTWAGQVPTNGIDVIHDSNGVVRTYYQGRQFSIAGVADTDGISGADIVVIWAGNSGGFNGIDVIHDASGTVASYFQNRQFGINKIADTDGNPGLEIIVVWGGAPGFNGIDVIHDSSRTTNTYVINAVFAIGGVCSYEGHPGNDICYSEATTGTTRYWLIVDFNRTTVQTTGCPPCP
ncbi:MAG TPA: hypothetical protein VFV34_24650 [Blastocatellia bacterium]|nr:hypothetical protein [Blastocatellia bacterium]